MLEEFAYTLSVDPPLLIPLYHTPQYLIWLCLYSLQTLRRQLQEQRVHEEAHTLQMTRENEALRQELALYKSFVGNQMVRSAVIG